MADAPAGRASVRVKLLGGFAVWVDSRPVAETAWRLRKAKDLVKVLALADGQRLHREQVMDLLWPHLPAAANYLHQVLYRARRAWPPAPPTPAGG